MPLHYLAQSLSSLTVGQYSPQVTLLTLWGRLSNELGAVTTVIRALLPSYGRPKVRSQNVSQMHQIQLHVCDFISYISSPVSAISDQSDVLTHSSRELSELLRQQEHCVLRRLIVITPPSCDDGVIILQRLQRSARIIDRRFAQHRHSFLRAGN